MIIGPLNDETLGIPRQPAGHDREGPDIDGCLILTVASMEVRTSKMVHLVVVHPNGDSVEVTDP